LHCTFQPFQTYIEHFFSFQRLTERHFQQTSIYFSLVFFLLFYCYFTPEGRTVEMCQRSLLEITFLMMLMLSFKYLLIYLLTCLLAYCCSMGHDNAGGVGGAWFLDRVEVELPLWNRRWNFPHSRWLSKDDDDRELEHTLYPDNVDFDLP